jgi:transcriptional regulator with XRE-family HTH domain
MRAKTEKNRAPKQSLHKFGQKLINQMIKRREQLGLSQDELEEKIGVADALVAKWEVGIRKPSGFLLFCWADALECDLVLQEKPDGEVQ